MLAVAIVVSAVQAQTPAPTTYNFTTLAGDFSRGSVNAVGLAARFAEPFGVACDSAGTVYVSDAANHTIRKVTAQGLVSTFAGQPGKSGSADGDTSTALFFAPMGLALDHQGNLYVADSNNCTIRKITPAGRVSTLAGSPRLNGSADGVGSEARFHLPRGLVADASGNIFVTDYANSTIRKITPGGVVSTFAGAPEQRDGTDGVGASARFFSPAGIALDANGTFYVTDREVVRKISPNGTTATLAGAYGMHGSADGVGSAATFGYSNEGVAVDAAGNVYVADPSNNTVRKITPSGTVSTLAGSPGVAGDEDGTNSAARFIYPAGLAIGATNNLVVADQGANTLRNLSAAGVVTTLAGRSPLDVTGSVDGVGATARFYQPDGMAFGPSGDLYLADRGNHTVRKISPTGAAVTIAGKAGVSGFANGVGEEARFAMPCAVAVDPAGNVYVADQLNSSVRKITPAGMVSTFAGQPGVYGVAAEGSVADVRFASPSGLALDAAGNLYVADRTQVIHRLGTNGQVTNFKGPDYPNYLYFEDVAVDASGNIYASAPNLLLVAKFVPSGTCTLFPVPLEPGRIALDGRGNLFLASHTQGVSVIGELMADGTSRVCAGSSGIFTHVDGLDSLAEFNGTSGIAVDSGGNLYVSSDEGTIRKGQLGGLPVIATQPQSQSLAAGGGVQFSVTASADPAPTYQWYFNGAALSGATSSSYSLASIQAANAGDYAVVVTNAFGSVTSSKATLTATAAPPSSGGGDSGGGAMDATFAAALSILAWARRRIGGRRVRPE